jgi:hypothetical protein
MELTVREHKTLKDIVHFILNDPLHQPPSHRELLNALNEQGENLVSLEQTMRVVHSLRKKGLIVDIEPEGLPLRRNRNMVPTEKGRKLAVLKAKAVT